MNRENETKRKRGRPGGEVVRGKRCQIPLSVEEFETVDYLAKRIGKTKADIFREAFKMYNNYMMVAKPPDIEEDDVYEDYEYYEEYESEDDFDEENW